MSLGQMIREAKRSPKIVSPRYRAWLARHMDDPLPQWVVDRITDELLKRQRDRSNSFSASSAGYCKRRRELAYLGIAPNLGQKPDARLLNTFNDGRWRHLRWQANLLASGILTDIEVPMVWRAKRHRGTLDGVGVVPDDHPVVAWRGKEFGFELKGVNPYGYGIADRKDEQQDSHKSQVHEYFLSSGFELFVILYEDKGGSGWNEWVIAPDENLLHEVSQDINIMNHDIDRQILRPMLASCRIRKGPNWSGCPYAGNNGPCEAAADWPAPVEMVS